MISQQITSRNLQNFLTFGKIINNMGSIAPWWLYLTSFILPPSSSLCLTNFQSSSCFVSKLSHIIPVHTESSILAFLRLIHIFFHDTTISSDCLCFLFCNSQGRLNWKYDNFEKIFLELQMHLDSPLYMTNHMNFHR